MSLGTIVKWVAVLVVLGVLWKLVLPRVMHDRSASTATTSSSGTGTLQAACVPAAERASDAWGNGLRQFINPPYDLEAWSTFRNDVETRISSAESACSCPADSCVKSRDAMRDLRALMTDMDASIRSGSPPPSDVVQRQEAIDNQISGLK
jgi:hypothetical protein